MDSKEATPSEDTENAEKEAVKNITFLKQNLDFFSFGPSQSFYFNIYFDISGSNFGAT